MGAMCDKIVETQLSTRSQTDLETQGLTFEAISQTLRPNN